LFLFVFFLEQFKSDEATLPARFAIQELQTPLWIAACLAGAPACGLPPRRTARLHELFSPKLFYWQNKSPMPCLMLCIMLCIMLRSPLASTASALPPGVLQSPGRRTFPSPLASRPLSTGATGGSISSSRTKTTALTGI
jgi:hypothetical protein